MYIHAGSNANPQPCKYYVDLQRLAEPMFHDVQEYTTLDQFTSSQQSLLASYHELTERMETSDSLHFPGPISGRHKCLDSAYREAYTHLRTLAIRLPQDLPPASEPPPSPQPLTDAELMAYLERWGEESVKRTFFGTEQDGDKTA